MLDDAIEVYHQRASVDLLCGKMAFARIRNLLLSEANLAEGELPTTGTIIIIEFGGTPIPPKSRLRERIAFVGCAFVLCLLLVVFGAGIQTIWRWLMGGQ